MGVSSRLLADVHRPFRISQNLLTADILLTFRQDLPQRDIPLSQHSLLECLFLVALRSTEKRGSVGIVSHLTACTCASTASPIGDRQIFPRHTISTVLVMVG